MAEEASESETILENENGIYVTNGNMKVNGNLEVQGQVQSEQIKVREDNQTILSTSGGSISFRKACLFTKPVQFNNGDTTIGVEGTYNSAYVGSPTIHAGDRIILGDSLLKLDASERQITADTFGMSLKKLVVDNAIAKKLSSELVQTENAKVTGDLISQNLFADVIKTNKLYIEKVSCLQLSTSQQMSVKDLNVLGTTTLQNDIIIQGKSCSNGAALTVNGGSLIANKGIISHTRKNEFQCLDIMGSGTDHDTCFTVYPFVDTLFQGNVTIQDSNLVLDNSKLVTDNVVVTQLSENGDEAAPNANGVQLTSNSNWETYRQAMVNEIPTERAFDQQYDPYASVESAMERNEVNYRSANLRVKTILNPITYLMEKNDQNIPKAFTVKNGTYRIDSNGNALLTNVVSQKARFSELEAFKFKVNSLNVDKLITTAVASDVVHTDNLMKSEGIAEFDGSVYMNADMFVESDKNVVVKENANVTFQNGASLVMKNGANLEMGTNTTMKMAGDIEIDLEKLVFLDSKTGNKYKISFRDAKPFEGCGVVMDYEKVEDAERDVGECVMTEVDARELDKKLKSLGI